MGKAATVRGKFRSDVSGLSNKASSRIKQAVKAGTYEKEYPYISKTYSYDKTC